MRGKDFNTGLRGTLFEAAHYARMGPAVWLYGWLVLRQTRQEGEIGWVLGGARISYREIEEETGFERKTLERWMAALRHGGYIETSSAPAGIVIRITKAKKFQRLAALPGSSGAAAAFGSAGSRRAARDGETPRLNFEERRRENEEGCPQVRGGAGRKTADSNRDPRGIGSGSLEREIKNKSACRDSEKQLMRTGRLEHVSEGAAAAVARALHWRELREEREEMVRRELRVGAGPEGPPRPRREEES